MSTAQIDRCQIWCVASGCPKSCESFVSSVKVIAPNMTLVSRQSPQLFDFKNLESFSLRLEPGFYASRFFDMSPGVDSSVDLSP